MMSVKHFLTLQDFSSDELQHIIQRAGELKQNPEIAIAQPRKSLGLIFEKSSTRTRLAFEVAMNQLDGSAVFLANADSQLGRGEPIEDSARVLAGMVDCVAIRTFEHEKLVRFAEYSSVPVINALTDDYHPCQLLADVQTFAEHRGSIAGKTVAWVGDGNNMCHSYINAADKFDFQLNIASPQGFEPNPELVSKHKSRVELSSDPSKAVRDADLVVTDVWASMGQEDEQDQRLNSFAGFQVDEQLMALAHNDALFMHCLPAHRGEEVSASILDAKDSVVWDEAENRMHSQKALIEFLLSQ
ncbi:MAG: ornithine carbamoyltransferase, catabolic [Pseudohongiella sp.]|nr:MAG: ornithine carbamoyltransferase, catabolic [Pseudohongiella sp.]